MNTIHICFKITICSNSDQGQVWKEYDVTKFKDDSGFLDENIKGDIGEVITNRDSEKGSVASTTPRLKYPI